MKETDSKIFRDRDFSDGLFMSLVISFGNQRLGKRYLNNVELRAMPRHFARGGPETRLHEASVCDRLVFLQHSSARWS